MKKIFVGLLALGSMSSFASECNLTTVARARGVLLADKIQSVWTVDSLNQCA